MAQPGTVIRRVLDRLVLPAMAAFFIWVGIVPWLFVVFNPPVSALPLIWLVDGMMSGVYVVLWLGWWL